ncbi:hypothetical protein M0804_006749 [Polistes exclamans]|nr:hypothetical protein M0804_006749 [Polistes exclamans]
MILLCLTKTNDGLEKRGVVDQQTDQQTLRGQRDRSELSIEVFCSMTQDGIGEKYEKDSLFRSQTFMGECKAAGCNETIVRQEEWKKSERIHEAVTRPKPGPSQNSYLERIHRMDETDEERKRKKTSRRRRISRERDFAAMLCSTMASYCIHESLAVALFGPDGGDSNRRNAMMVGRAMPLQQPPERRDSAFRCSLKLGRGDSSKDTGPQLVAFLVVVVVVIVVVRIAEIDLSSFRKRRN